MLPKYSQKNYKTEIKLCPKEVQICQLPSILALKVKGEGQGQIPSLLFDIRTD